MNMDLRLGEKALTREELREASDVSSRAFFDDEFFRFLFPSDSLRQRALCRLFAAQIRHLGSGGRLVTARDTSGAIVGISAWLPSSSFPQSFATQLTQLPGTVRAFYRRPRSLSIANAYLRTLLKIHPRAPHWYLLLLAVDPQAQRRGVGTTLMEHGLAWADHEGVGSYLETQKEENLAYYRRFGYELQRTVHAVREGPAYYTMWREAR